MRITVNPNKEIVQQTREKIKANDGYCYYYKIKNEDTKCMCKEFREQTVDGYCHCGLYEKILEENI